MFERRDVWAPAHVQAKSLAQDSHEMCMLLQEHIIFINPASILCIIIFIQRKSTYYEYFALIQSRFPLRRDYFHKNNILRNNSLHPSQGRIQLPLQLDYDFLIHLASASTLPKRPAPKSHVPK